MVKKLSYLIYRILNFLDFIFFKITKKRFMNYIYDFIRSESHSSIIINNQNINFFTPNQITKWRVDTFFTKEPETLQWIDSFKDDEKIIFWDIGANIGLYSIYSSIKFNNINVYAFEPSTSNLGILTRNISLNHLSEKIIVNQIPLTDKENQYLMMRENNFIEGGALNSFGVMFDSEGKKFEGNNNYKLYGTSINYLIRNKILEIPDYIKIDVDGIEHLILRGGKDYLKDKKIKSILIELNENFKEQYSEALKILEQSNFVLKHKKHSKMFAGNGKFSKTYNFLFEKN